MRTVINVGHHYNRIDVRKSDQGDKKTFEGLQTGPDGDNPKANKSNSSDSSTAKPSSTFSEERLRETNHRFQAQYRFEDLSTQVKMALPVYDSINAMQENSSGYNLVRVDIRV